jgi:hypothetical protein
MPPTFTVTRCGRNRKEGQPREGASAWTTAVHGLQHLSEELMKIYKGGVVLCGVGPRGHRHSCQAVLIAHPAHQDLCAG